MEIEIRIACFSEPNEETEKRGKKTTLKNAEISRFICVNQRPINSPIGSGELPWI